MIVSFCNDKIKGFYDTVVEVENKIKIIIEKLKNLGPYTTWYSFSRNVQKKVFLHSSDIQIKRCLLIIFTITADIDYELKTTNV